MTHFTVAPLVAILSSSAQGITTKSLKLGLQKAGLEFRGDSEFRVYLFRANLVLQSIGMHLNFIPNNNKWLLVVDIPKHPWLQPMEENIIGGAVMLYLSQNKEPFSKSQLLNILKGYKISNLEDKIEKLVKENFLTVISVDKLTIGKRLHQEINIDDVLAKSREFME